LVVDDDDALAGVQAGQILAGKYRIERVLGVGGMGVVVAARHVELDSLVAIKFLLPAMLSNQEAVTRFAREARAAVKIQSEHVARVLDVGTLDNGAPYMVMEFLEGGDLASWLKNSGPLPIEQSVEFVLQACVALADAHGLGIVHRDLKPANLFCVRRSDGQFVIKVIDFGISKVTNVGRASNPPGATATKLGAVMGSPLYMSPEQVQSTKDVDHRTDVWALGIILFELLSGTVPFQGEGFGEIAVKIATRQPPSLGIYRPDVPAGLEAVIRRCLEKDRNHRYPNVGELALALLPFAPKRGRALVEHATGIIQSTGLSGSAMALPSSASGVEETSLAPGTNAPWAGATKQRRSRLIFAWGVAVLGLLAGIGAVFFLHRHAADLRARTNPILAQPVPSVTSPDAGMPMVDAAREVDAAEVLVPLSSARPSSAPSSSSVAQTPRTGPASGVARPPTIAPVVPPPVVTAKPASKLNCDPPFVLDAQGQKHFKPECYR
jgi:serine/threonine-protein kinase